LLTPLVTGARQSGDHPRRDASRALRDSRHRRRDRGPPSPSQKQPATPITTIRAAKDAWISMSPPFAAA